MDLLQSQNSTEATMRLQNEGASSTFVCTNPAATFEYKHPEQSYMLYNISSSNVPPFSSPGSPKIRIIGLFPSVEQAASQGHLYYEQDTTCSIFAGDTHEWHAVIAEYPMLNEKDYITTTVKQHEQDLADAKKQFEERVKDWEEITPAEDEPEPQQEEDAAEDAKVESEDGNADPEAENSDPKDDIEKEKVAARFNSDFKVMGQNWAVVNVIVDNRTEDVKVPLFRVLQAFDSEAEAGDFIRNCAGQHIQNYDLLIAPLYTWLDVQSAHETLNVIHREDVLNKLAEGRKLDAAKIAQVKQTAGTLE